MCIKVILAFHMLDFIKVLRLMATGSSSDEEDDPVVQDVGFKFYDFFFKIDI